VSIRREARGAQCILNVHKERGAQCILTSPSAYSSVSRSGPGEPDPNFKTMRGKSRVSMRRPFCFFVSYRERSPSGERRDSAPKRLRAPHDSSSSAEPPPPLAGGLCFLWRAAARDPGRCGCPTQRLLHAQVLLLLRPPAVTLLLLNVVQVLGGIII